MCWMSLIWVVCSLGSSTSLHLSLPLTTTGGWVARKYFAYTSQLGTCMGGFGGVVLLLDNTAVPPGCSLSYSVACGAAKRQVCHLTKGWWCHCVHSSLEKKQCSLLQQKLGLCGEVTSTKDRN